MKKSKTYICPTCGNSFTRPASHIRRIKGTPVCSQACVVVDNAGTNNPNYKDGNTLNIVCTCGNPKDSRAKQCAECAGVGYSVGAKYQPLKTRAEVLRAVAMSKTYVETAEKLGINRKSVVKLIGIYAPDVRHFIRTGHRPYAADTALLKLDKRISGSILRTILINEKGVAPACASCNHGMAWNNKPLVLQVHHKNGCSTDHRFENLELLCPNCHTQTGTFTGRNMTMNKRKKNEDTEDL